MSEKNKSAAAPSSSSDTAAAISDAMKKTGYNNTAVSTNTVVSGVEEAFSNAGPASAKVNQRQTSKLK